MSRLAALSKCVSAPVLRGRERNGTASSFISGEAMPPLSDVIQEGGTISPHAYQKILRSHHLPPSYLPAFSKGALQRLRGSTPATLWTAKTSVVEPHWLPKLTKISPSHFPNEAMALGKYFPCAFPFVLFSISLYSMTRAPSPPQHLQSISPSFLPQTSPHFLPSTKWPLLSL